jgi:tRNA-splicing ligase RtcB
MQQLGTLGGGNHFIEVCLDTEGRVWLMLHSGSRGVGNELAQFHIERAKELPHNADLEDPNLAVFVVGSPTMDAYRRDLFWAQDYARRNRAVMMALLRDVVRHQFRKVSFETEISCHHNYVAEEVHDGHDVLVTRKGRDPGGRRGPGHHSRLDGRVIVHRAWARRTGRARVGLTRRRPADEPGSGPQSVQGLRPCGADARGGMP